MQIQTIQTGIRLGVLALAGINPMAMQIADAQTRVNLRTQSNAVDFSAADSTKPFKSGTALPQTCQKDESFLKSDASGQALYLCGAPNVWTAVGAGSGAGVPTYTAVAYVATPTFSIGAGVSQGFAITLTGDVPSSSFSGFPWPVRRRGSGSARTARGVASLRIRPTSSEMARSMRRRARARRRYFTTTERTS